MNIKSNEELTEFCREKWKKSGLTIREISEKIGVDERYLAKAVQKKRKSNFGIQRQLLEYLGFAVKVEYNVIRQKKT